MNLKRLVLLFVVLSFVPVAVMAQKTPKADFKKAVKLHNSAFARMQKAGENDAETIKLYTQAIDEYKRCITVTDKNTGEAYHYLGRILFTGPSSLRNYPEAVQYLYEAVDIHEKEKKTGWDIPRGYNEIGTALYRMGDYTSAFANWSKSSELSGQYAGDEAQLYWLGLGVEQNLTKAMELYKNAALTGRDLWANIYSLDYQIKEFKKGNFYNEGLDFYLDYFHSMSMGDPRDVWMAKLKQAADLNWPPAQVDYWVYSRDNKEVSKGLPYLQKAVEANFVPAFFHMGYVYNAGLGTKVNYEEARKWYEKAAKEGFPIAQSNLGAMYYTNQITADQGLSNKEMANYWWTVSADQGFSLAIQNKTLVESYRPPMSKLEAVAQILNSVSSLMNASMDIYKTVNKARAPSYVPQNNQTQTVQNSSTASNTNSSTAGNTRAQTLCPICKGSGKCEYSGFAQIVGCRGGIIECNVCKGDGTSKNSVGKDQVCKNCKGKGKLECGVCHGSGICTRCKGAKWI